MRRTRKIRLSFVLLLLAAARGNAAPPAPVVPAPFPEASRLLALARESAAGIADLTARRNLLFSLLNAQERAEDWSGMGPTFAALDGLAPAHPTYLDRLHPNLERARWLAHTNRADEAKKLLRDLAEQAAAWPDSYVLGFDSAHPAERPDGREDAFAQIGEEQRKLHDFDGAIVTAKRLTKPALAAQELYTVMWTQARQGDKASALKTAALTADPLNRTQALLGYASALREKGQTAAFLAAQQEALTDAIAMPPGKSRHDALGMLLSEYQGANNAPGQLAVAAASTDAAQKDEAREYAAESLWRKAKTETALSLAAQIETLGAEIQDPAKRLNTAFLAVMLRAWGGDSAGAKALAARTVAADNAAFLLVTGRRLRELKDPAATRTLQEQGRPVAQMLIGGLHIAMPDSNEFFAALLGGASRRDALTMADSLPTDENKLRAYDTIQRGAVFAKDADALKALRNRVEPLIAKETEAWTRNSDYRRFAAVYAATGETARVTAFAETIPEPHLRARALTDWSEWQARTDPKAARETLRKAGQVAAQTAVSSDTAHWQMDVARAMLTAGANADAAALLAHLDAAEKTGPDDPLLDEELDGLAALYAELGNVNRALQMAQRMRLEQGRMFTLTTIAESVNRSGKIDLLPPLFAAMKDETSRRDLLLHLVWQSAADTDEKQRQQYLALATDDGGRAAVLLAIAQKQVGSNLRLPARLTLKELLPLLARTPPGIPQTQALVQAAKLLNTVGREDEARTLLQSAATDIVRVMRPGIQANWHLPPTEPYTGTRLSAENEWEVELLDIAEAQSGAGDLEAALQTIRHLRADQLRQFAVYENVHDWLGSPAPSHDAALLTQLTRPDERPYALLTAANVLLPPANIGF